MSPQGSTFGGIRLVVGWRGWWPTVRSRNSPSPFVIASPGPRAPRRSIPPPGRESAERTGCNDAAESRAVAVAPPLHLLRSVENEELKQQLAAAHRAGRRQAGVETVKEQCRDVQRFRVAEDLWRDLRYGFRRLLARPILAVVAVAVLAVGIGANVAILALADALLLRPLPGADPSRLVEVFTSDHSSGRPLANSYPDFLDIREGRIPDFPVTRSHPPASWPSAANSSICRTYRKTAGEESRRRSPVANRWMRP